MAGDAITSLDVGARAALEAGKPLIYVCPPAAWAAAAPLSALPDVAPAEGPRLVVIVPEIGDALDVARTFRPLPGFEPILPVSGIARAARLLAGGAVKTLAVTVRDAVRLAEMSRLKLGTTPVVALLWPELRVAAGDGALLDTLLAEATQAQRIIVTSDLEAVKDLTERHVRRAPLVVSSRPPASPVVPVRYVVTDGERRLSAIRGILDSLNPAATLLWEPSPDRYERWVEFAEDPTVTIADAAPADRKIDTIIAVELPAAELLSTFATITREIVVLVRASQLPYLRRIAAPLKHLALSGAADRAREQAFQLRQSVRARLQDADVSPELLALAPLFDEFEPALVAAALARGPAAAAPAAAAPVEESQAAMPAWVRIRVGVGTRDRVRPADLVGALLNGVGLQKDRVGKVDIKEGFSIIEVRAEDAPRTMKALVGLKVRGKPLGARVGN